MRVLATLLVSGWLAGCGGGRSSGAPAGVTDSAAAAAATAAAAAAAEADLGPPGETGAQHRARSLEMVAGAMRLQRIGIGIKFKNLVGIGFGP